MRAVHRRLALEVQGQAIAAACGMGGKEAAGAVSRFVGALTAPKRLIALSGRENEPEDVETAEDEDQALLERIQARMNANG